MRRLVMFVGTSRPAVTDTIGTAPPLDGELSTGTAQELDSATETATIPSGSGSSPTLSPSRKESLDRDL
jgi:hypothetical protein